MRVAVLGLPTPAEFHPPPGAAAAIALGAGMGALMGKLGKAGISKQFEEQIRGLVQPGTSCGELTTS